MLERLTASHCSAWIGAAFRVAGTEGPIVLSLDAVAPARASAAAERPFSLLFRGPAQPVLPQAIYTLESDVAPPLSIFLVPIGRDSEGVTYEAVFN